MSIYHSLKSLDIMHMKKSSVPSLKCSCEITAVKLESESLNDGVTDAELWAIKTKPVEPVKETQALLSEDLSSELITDTHINIKENK